MATEPLDALNDSDLLERRRWGGGTKFYTRKNKGQRNSNSSATSASAAASSEPATVSANDEVSKGPEIGNSESHREGEEGDRKILGVEDGKLLQPEAYVLADDPSREVPPENCDRLGKEEVAGDGGVDVSTTEEPLVNSIEVIVPTEDGVGETVDQEIANDQLGQVIGDGPGETADGKSNEPAVPSEVGSPIELEKGSSNDLLQPIRDMVEEDKLSQEVGDSHGDAANPNNKDPILDGNEAQPLSKDDNQSQHEDVSNVEIVRQGPRETTGPSSNDAQSGHDEGTSHVETSLCIDDVLPENRAALGPQDVNSRLGEGGGASGGETVRISDVKSLESGEVVVPPPSSGCDVAADGNEVVRQSKPQQGALEQSSVMTRVDDKLRINVSGARSGDEIRGVKRKLETELDQVRSLFKRLHAKELQVTSSNSNMNNGIISNVETINTNNINNAVTTYGQAYIQPHARNDSVERTLTRANSEVGSVLYHPNKLFNRSLSVSVTDNNHGVGEFVEREKRTPKANQLYRNSEFLLGKDRLPSESSKKLKSNGTGRKDVSEMERRFGLASNKNRERVFRSCNTLLQRLMKHNFGWVFNEPVDVKKLMLHDYFDIIKHPMDLGTIKSRLSQNYYKSPIEFAEDVRLVFHNAMRYNPKGHDVNVMAETLLNIFEERWAVIEAEYNRDWGYQVYQDAGLHTPPTSRKISASQFYTPARVPMSVHTSHVPAPVYASVTPVPQPTLENSQLVMNTVPNMKPPNTLVGRTPAPKKPKARDPHKRDMTYDEKQKLSSNLQSLPSEKLDAIVHIIKRRNSALNQNNDEIEVDIDSVDAETLWELDRFVTNYKKSLSKNKRKAELALQSQAGAVQTTDGTSTVPRALEMQKDTRIGDNNEPPGQVEKQGDHASRSSSSSSSTSDSGSSSSDSDSDSSSSCGSEPGRSPRT
ncbi:hypothetical protein LIER_01800 [Lithospermum erythrorhizon]|uniref:Transcription factor GTE4-like n=1 Tax=Lithospermum erythrorhizon TaxID=34254 RepID=A0AAV3NM75_LITER